MVKPTSALERVLARVVPGAVGEWTGMRTELRRLSSEVGGLRHQVRAGEVRSWESEVLERFDDLLQRVGAGHALLAHVADPDHRPEAGRLDRMWRMPHRGVPYSCTDEEGLVLYSLIVENELTRGFEVATAFGFSSAFISAAFSDTGGKLTSLDCYVEEELDSDQYTQEQLLAAVERVRRDVAQGRPPEGLATARRLNETVGRPGTVDFEVGLSPDDVPALLHGEALDFAFIDGGHYGDQPTKDVEALLPLLGDRFLLAFHDNYPGYSPIEQAVAVAEQALGLTSVRLPTRNWLTLVSRGLDPASVTTARGLVSRAVFPE